VRPENRLHRLTVPLLFTAAIVLSRLIAVPALSDPTGAALSPSLHLHTPWLYLILAPLFSLWDGVSMLSMSRLEGFLFGLVLLYLLWRLARNIRPSGESSRGVSWLREILTLGFSATLFLIFVISGALWHRPMLSLAGADSNVAIVDFHSHTNASHDVRNTLMRGFNAEANRRWHERAGFDAAFITDHNSVAGFSPKTRKPALCHGIEVSAWRAHIVLLGDTAAVDPRRYNRSMPELLELLRTSESTYQSFSVASLPEYRRNHWQRLDQLLRAGLDGFEITNAAPKANELTRVERDNVIALARSANVFLVGVSDSHGWGATSMVWNLVRLRDAASKSADVCTAVLRQLRGGFPAVQVVERNRLRPDAWWPMWLTPIGVLWESWRSMPQEVTVAWLVWIWVGAAAGWSMRSHLARHRRQPSG
jgi:hypothetical protein